MILHILNLTGWFGIGFGLVLVGVDVLRKRERGKGSIWSVFGSAKEGKLCKQNFANGGAIL